MKEVIFNRQHTKNDLEAQRKVPGSQPFDVNDGTIYLASDGEGIYLGMSGRLYNVGETNLTKEQLYTLLGIDRNLENVTVADLTSNIYRFMGNVASLDNLYGESQYQGADVKTGHVYNALDTGMNYAAIVDESVGVSSKSYMSFLFADAREYANIIARTDATHSPCLVNNSWNPMAYEVGQFYNEKTGNYDYALFHIMYVSHLGAEIGVLNSPRTVVPAGKYFLCYTFDFSGSNINLGATWNVVLRKSISGGNDLYSIPIKIGADGGISGFEQDVHSSAEVSNSYAVIPNKYRVTWDALGSSLGSGNAATKQEVQKVQANVEITAREVVREELGTIIDDNTKTISTLAAELNERMDGFGAGAKLPADGRSGGLPRVGAFDLSSYDAGTPVLVNSDGELVGGKGALLDGAYRAVAGSYPFPDKQSVASVNFVEQAISKLAIDEETVKEALAGVVVPKIGTEPGEVPSIGVSLAGKNNFPVVIDASGTIKPWAYQIGDAARCTQATSIYQSGNLANVGHAKSIVDNFAHCYLSVTDDSEHKPAPNEFIAGMTNGSEALGFVPVKGTKITISFAPGLPVNGDVIIDVLYRRSDNPTDLGTAKGRLLCNGVNVRDRICKGGVYEVVFDGTNFHILGGMGGNMYWQE